MEADRDELTKIPDIGPVMSGTVVQFCSQPQTKILIRKLKASGLKFTEDIMNGPHPLSGKTFVLTGELSEITRAQAQALIRQLGGHDASPLVS